MEPLAPASASGEFSDYEQLKLEFATQLLAKIKPEVVSAGNIDQINNSALQIFARELRKVDAFCDGGVAAARMPGEAGSSDFVLMHTRYVLVPSYRAARPRWTKCSTMAFASTLCFARCMAPRDSEYSDEYSSKRKS